MRMDYELNGKPVSKQEGKVIALEISRAMRERRERQEQVRALARRPERGDAADIRFAMRCVEHRIVRGLWVLELSLPSDGPAYTARHGLDYMNDHSDVDARYTDAAGKKWEAPPPRPAIPSNREIESAKEAKSWIEWLDPAQARLLNLAALSKRGDRERRIDWERVFSRLPHLRQTKLRTLRDRYDQALRNIVAEMTIRRLEI